MMNIRSASSIFHLAGGKSGSRFGPGYGAGFIPRIIAAFGGSSVRWALIVLVFGLFLPDPWSGRVFSHSRAMVGMTGESVGIFADQAGTMAKTVFDRGEKVWALENGASLPIVYPFPVGNVRQRRFQWIAPDGTVKQQSDVTTDGQSDSYQLSPTAQVGTWQVKTVDNSSIGFAVAEFIVRDPNNPSADLSVGVFGSPQATAGGSISYRVQVTNNGPNDATTVQLTDAVTGAATFQSMTQPQIGSCTSGGPVTCTFDTLAAGATATFTIVYQVSDTAAGDSTISNEADVSSSTTELHADDNTATSTASVKVSSCTFTCPDNISQAHDPGMNGAVVTYTTPSSSSGCDAVICTPASGSFFPAGLTPVVCSSLSGGSCSFTVTITGTLTIALNGTDPMTVECHTKFDDPGVTTQGDGNIQVTSSSQPPLDVNTPGTYLITYTATNGTSTATAMRTVNVVDTTAPVLLCPDVVSTLPPNTTDTSMAVNYPSIVAIESCSTATITSPPTPPSGSVFPLGATQLTATAADAAGNTSSCNFTVTVFYNFSGFFQPVGTPPTLNVVQAGRAIPVKFSLSGNKGLNIFASDYPTSGDIPCDSTSPLTDVQQTITAGQSSLSYDAASDQYTYVWKTDSSWAGTCRQLIIKLNDGSTHFANFKFR